VEVLASKVWPNALHAAIAVPDPRKGEQVILLTTCEDAERGSLLSHAQDSGVAEISVPRQVMYIPNMPVLGTGKIDYVAASKLVEA
jgi:acyl-[acyl-carrier-protein]-phospholipid O-acyltransferase/long-chain-fatty-acid--[acyl-carrier-protein] ligase